MRTRALQTATGLGLGLVVLTLGIVAPRLEMKENLALVMGLVGAGVILAHPFVGVFLLVFLIQLGGLVGFLVGNQAPFVLEGLAALTFGGLILQAPGRPRRGRWGFNPPAFQMACLFILAAAVSGVFAEFPDEAREATTKYISLLLLFFLIIVTANTTDRVVSLMMAIVASTAISGAISFASYLSGGSILGIVTSSASRQVGASSNDPTTTGNVMMIGAALGVLLALRSPRWRMLGATAGVFGIAGIVFSYSRSALLMVAAAAGWLAFKFRKSRYLAAGVILAILGSAAALPLIPERVWDRLGALGNPSADWTLGRRWGYHVIGFDLWAKNPILGVGPGNFSEHYQAYEYRWIQGRQLEGRNLHNMYLSVATETGLVGLGFFSAMLLFAMVGLHRARTRARDPTLRLMAEVVQYGFTLFLITAITLPAIDYKILWALTGLATVIPTIAENSDSIENQGVS